jgi:hypothetical protein
VAGHKPEVRTNVGINSTELMKGNNKIKGENN